jgi:hypothetical protein
VQHAQHYHVVVHVVSHPLTSIAAAIFDDDWHTKTTRLFPKLGEDLHLPSRNRALRVLAYWVATNTLLETYTTKRVRVDQLTTAAEIADIPRLHLLPNTALHAIVDLEQANLGLARLTWRDISAIDPVLAQQVCDMAHRYGYTLDCQPTQ